LFFSRTPAEAKHVHVPPGAWFLEKEHKIASGQQQLAPEILRASKTNRERLRPMPSRGISESKHRYMKFV